MYKEYIIESQLLHQKITVKETEGGEMSILCSDGVNYTPKEVFLTCFAPERSKFPKQIHLIKKLLGGELVAVRGLTKEDKNLSLF